MMKKSIQKLPSSRQIERELQRVRYRSRYRSVLRSTVYTLVTVAAIAILVATLWIPVLRIYGSSMTPTLQDGQIVLSVKTSDVEEGDIFILRILDETLTYEVDQIRIVDPYELDEIEIVEGQDYCTLVTCTPYGINTHRLLVRGHRVENQPVAQTVRVTADAMQIEPMLVAPVVAAPMLLILLIVLLVSTRRKNEKGGRSL